MSPASDTLEELVHIIPIGYEIDRVVSLFQDYKAHRVHIISMNDLKKYNKPQDQALTSRQHEYDKINCELLTEMGIEVHIHLIDMFDIISVMETISRLIVKEKANGHRVYVNMSACGKIASVGATLAAMIHNVRLYYIRADRYSATADEQKEHGISICESVNLLRLENFQFALPDKNSLLLLTHLAKLKEDEEISCDALIHFLHENEVEGFEIDFWNRGREERRKYQTNYLMKLQNRFLNKLDESGYISKRKLGKNKMVKLTKTGRYVAAVSGID